MDDDHYCTKVKDIYASHWFKFMHLLENNEEKTELITLRELKHMKLLLSRGQYKSCALLLDSFRDEFGMGESIDCDIYKLLRYLCNNYSLANVSYMEGYDL